MTRHNDIFGGIMTDTRVVNINTIPEYTLVDWYHSGLSLLEMLRANASKIPYPVKKTLRDLNITDWYIPFSVDALDEGQPGLHFKIAFRYSEDAVAFKLAYNKL
jgi:hypothetical protein